MELSISVNTTFSIQVRKVKETNAGQPAQSSNAVMEPQLDIVEEERNYKIGK